MLITYTQVDIGIIGVSKQLTTTTLLVNSRRTCAFDPRSYPGTAHQVVDGNSRYVDFDICHDRCCCNYTLGAAVVVQSLGADGVGYVTESWCCYSIQHIEHPCIRCHLHCYSHCC